jgi:pimeloyl-ACP methyl ester carboxylesterase
LQACRSLLLVAALALTLLTSAATAQVKDDVVGNLDVGAAGASGAWLLESGQPTAIVVFLHGWRDVGTQSYLPWLDYLALNGTAVIFPRYQSTAGGDPAATLPAMRAGITAGLKALRNPDLPVTVVGYDYGARLAFYYAANARRWGLPVPYAVDSVFPTKSPAGMPALPAIPASSRVLLQVGADDTVAGRAGAADLWRGLAGHSAARKRYRVVASTPALHADHRAPLVYSAASQATFWPSLDALLVQSVGAG